MLIRIHARGAGHGRGDGVRRLERWDDLFQDTYNGDDPASSGFQSAEDERLYREEGKAIAIELTKAWPGKVEVDEQFR